ncbi:Type IV fimbrial biogenesis protein PilY1 [Labilithrix luteola]|uniref:Type IV fimbrial biogenesis protein PilY1 n=1 Tax=Labilithrix luteola TaxID=1391654 RepID=A0A0K1PK20_9BACT|nr:hypothetical protein [Labilithrix luteola]AKU93862.1 Type IV fimbrial biogenesis protein PilY1 [Labilithrix luteola]
MRSAILHRWLWATLVVVAAAGAACANNNEDGAAVDGADAGADANQSDVVLPGTKDDAGADGGIADASNDRDAGEQDAAPRICSYDGFCHTDIPSNYSVRGMWIVGDSVWAVAWIMGKPGAVLLRWDGASWHTEYTAQKRLNTIWASGPTDLWMGGDEGIFHGTGTSPSTITWQVVQTRPINSIWGSGPNDIWAVGAGDSFLFGEIYWGQKEPGKVLHYAGPVTDGGDGWSVDPITTTTGISWTKVWGTSANDVWIGGTDYTDMFGAGQGKVYHRGPDGNGGVGFTNTGIPNFGYPSGFDGTRFAGGTSVTANDVWLLGAGVYADSQFQGKARTDGSGVFDWTPYDMVCNHSCSYTRLLGAVWGTSPNDVYIAGENGIVRHWDGTKHSVVRITVTEIPVTGTFWTIAGTSNNDIWLGGDGLALHKSGKDKP